MTVGQGSPTYLLPATTKSVYTYSLDQVMTVGEIPVAGHNKGAYTYNLKQVMTAGQGYSTYLFANHNKGVYTYRLKQVCGVALSNRHSVGAYEKTSSHATRQGTLSHSRLGSLNHCGLILA